MNVAPVAPAKRRRQPRIPRDIYDRINELTNQRKAIWEIREILAQEFSTLPSQRTLERTVRRIEDAMRMPTDRSRMHLATQPDETQLLLLALAHLAVERPGWDEMIRRFVAERLGEEEAVYERLKVMHEARRGRPDEANDSIVQLRAVVEAKHPLLWAMVREIVWPP